MPRYASQIALIHHERFRTRQKAKAKLFDYIEVCYNRSRIHLATAYFAPAEDEALPSAVETGSVRLDERLISLSTKLGKIHSYLLLASERV